MNRPTGPMAIRPGPIARLNYHQGWVNGYWHGQNNSNWWNNGGGFWTGMAVGGIGAWGVGSSIYNWGYRPYVNPYAMATPVVIQQPVIVEQPVRARRLSSCSSLHASSRRRGSPPVDYSQPLNTMRRLPNRRSPIRRSRLSTPPGPPSRRVITPRPSRRPTRPSRPCRTTRPCMSSAPLPVRPEAVRTGGRHALRGPLGRPGWDWTTLIGLYPSVDVYTDQVHALEDYRTEHPDSAPPRFVLAYHYLTQGHTEAAVEELKEVVKLQPSDQLSAVDHPAFRRKGQAALSRPAPEPGPGPEAAPAAARGTWRVPGRRARPRARRSS